MQPIRITVVGAGVVGLSIAQRLARSNRVRLSVLADRVGASTSSRVAGAVWFPYLVSPGDERIVPWARATYARLRKLSKDPATGVNLALPTYLPADEKTKPAWAAALPHDAPLRWLEPAQLPGLLRGYLQHHPARGAWCFEAPVIDPERHLSWLVAQLPRGTLREEYVEALDKVSSDIVINCTGRRARVLTDDPLLRPAYGQIAVARAKVLPREYCFADDRDASAPLYSIPRAREVVLGGCNLTDRGSEEDWSRASSPVPDPGLHARLLERFSSAGFEPGEATAQAEWRPVREGGVRFETEGRILHCYGHGGAGFTLAQGCADAVLEVLEQRSGLRPGDLG